MKTVKLIKRCFDNVNSYHLLSLFIVIIISALITYSNLGTTKAFIGDDAGASSFYPKTQMTLVFNMWDSYSFPGRSNVIATISLIHAGFLYLLNFLGLATIFSARLMYLLFFSVSGFGAYLLCFHISKWLLKSSLNSIWIASITGMAFYMMNNFTMILLSFPPTNYVYSYMLLPWLFLLYLKDFHVSNYLWKRFLIVITFLFIISGNPANTISIVMLLLFYELFFREKNKIIYNFKKFIPTVILFFFISSYIYLPLLGNSGNPYGKVSSIDNRISILFSSSYSSFLNLFRLRGHPTQDNFIFSEFLLNNVIIFINYIFPIFSLGLFVTKKPRRMMIFLLATYLSFLFLAKAEHSPFIWINNFLYTKIPLFEMFRASYFKFTYFGAFSLSLMMPLTILTVGKYLSERSVTKRIKIAIFSLPLILISLGAIPFLFGQVARDIHKTVIPLEYHSVKEYLGLDRLDFSVLSLPQLYSGSILDWGNGNYYGGNATPDALMLDKPVWINGLLLPREPISTDFNFYKNIISKSNIKYVLLHKDIPEKYSFEVNMTSIVNGQTSYNKLNKQLTSDKNYKLIENNRYFNIFEINQQNFKPHFYIQLPTNFYLQSKEKLPSLEFTKINQTKYRVIVHKAKNSFRFVFSDNYNPGWKIYQPKQNKLPFLRNNLFSSYSHQLNDYFIYKGNEMDQANRDELKQFIKRGLVTTLGNEKDKIGFISKNFQNTIQNDNLSPGQLFETRFMNLIENNDNHFMINGYANGWILEPNKICRLPYNCQKNSDGTYDFELVVEFWPQQLFYLGLLVSSITVISSITYILGNFVIAKKTK